MSNTDKFNIIKINPDHSVEFKVSGACEVSLPAKPSIEQPLSQPRAQDGAPKSPSKKSDIKQTYYMSDELRLRVEKLRVSLLDRAGINVSKTDIGCAALEALIADYDRLGLDAPGIRRLLGR